MAHYLVTGHTGFKGAWLVFLLKKQGHDVSGIGLDPVFGSVFDRANLERDLVHDFRIDIRNPVQIREAIAFAQPDYVIHMAAQALVRQGYRDPRCTYETNVMGTLNVLEAVDYADSVRAQLVVTTDKVYLDQGLNRSYIETDKLGGKDPYSASKAMADVLAQEHLSRGRANPGAIARAGNVIGAGDVSRERLIPDIVRSIQANDALELRYPHAIRPWQHVLDCLGGYLALLKEVDENGVRGEFNFGPPPEDFASVQDVVGYVKSRHHLAIKDNAHSGEELMAEDTYLSLDSGKARKVLGWREKFSLTEAVDDATRSLNGMSASSVRALINETTSAWNCRVDGDLDF
jgi:CDP-glucose 4,6-dehydratase